MFIAYGGDKNANGGFYIEANHTQQSQTVKADRDYVDLLSGVTISRDECIEVEAVGVRILKNACR